MPWAGELLQRSLCWLRYWFPWFRAVVPVRFQQSLEEGVFGILPVWPVEYPRRVQEFFFAEDLRVVLVVLNGPGVQVGGLEAVGPIAEVVDLPIILDVPSCLDEGDPMHEFLHAVDVQDAVTVPVQAVFPH